MSNPHNPESSQITYADAGVNTDEGARAVDAIKQMVAATRRREVVGDIGGFGGLFSAAAFKDMDDPILISGTDGVGTKLVFAQLLDRHETVGQDLVAMCVNDILASGAEPLFFLDYVAIGHIAAEKMAHIVQGVADGCRAAGCALVGGEMAEHPGIMPDDEYDLAGFAVGVVDRAKMLGPDRVHPGDIIVGLSSTGIHSNGYSLVRRVLGIDGSQVRSDGGTRALREKLEGPCAELGGMSLGEALLCPTKIYVKPVRQTLRTGAPLHAMAHITGGGITENLNRALPAHVDAVVERCCTPGSTQKPGVPATFPWDVPPVIELMCQRAHLSPYEACKTFNMGVGMCLLCSADDEDRICKELERFGEHPFRVGRCVEGSGRVRYSDEY